MARHTHMLKTYSESQHKKRQESILLKARKEVDINAGGTSGYTVKSGGNTGKILGHVVKKTNSNW